MRATSEAPSLWRNGNWRLLWVGQSVSATGDMVFYITILLWIATIIAKGQPWAPAAASGALIATAAPVLVVGPLAGVFVDRWDRRRTMLTADVARFALIASLLILPLLRDQIPVGAQLAILYVVLAACSCFGEFFDPSRLAVIGAIVPPEQQAKASASLSASFSMAQILGPPIAAPLLITLGVQWALIVNAASFAISWICVRAISVPLRPAADAPARESFVAEFRTGIRFFVGSRILMTLGIGIVIAMLGNGAVNSLAVFFVPHNLHVNASWLGTIIGTVGGGAIIGALLTGVASRRVPPARLFYLSLIVCGVALIAMSRSTTLAPAIISAGFVGLGAGVLNSVVSPIILSVTPSNLLGRVSAVLSPLQQLASIVSMVLAGVLASTLLHGFHTVVGGVHFGPYDTVFAAAGLLFVIGGVAAIGPMRAADQAASAAGQAAPALPDVTPSPAATAELGMVADAD
jgi:MFS family permease